MLACLADFAGDYCRELSAEGDAAPEEPYCQLLPTCVAQGFAPAECRPPACPLRPDGCERVRNCLRGGVMDLYAQMAPVAVGGAGGGSEAAPPSSSAAASSSSSWGGGGGGGGGFFGKAGGKQQQAEREL